MARPQTALVYLPLFGLDHLSFTRFEGLDWLSFLEAFGHVVRYKEMPLIATLKKQGMWPFQTEGIKKNMLICRLHMRDEVCGGVMAGLVV